MGYKTEQFVGNVDENLICVICQEVLEDPCQCKEGHTFCRECITKWLKTNQKCPLGNNALKVNDLVRNLIVRNMIETHDVYCNPPGSDGQGAAGVRDSYERKCEWKGKLESLQKHRETCPFQKVKCPNAKCSRLIQRRGLEIHNMTCLYKEVKCVECGLPLLRNAVQNHLETDCCEVLIPCPNKCRDKFGIIKIKRRKKDAHITNSCAKTKVECPFKEQGCLVQVERQYAAKHSKENMAEHMVLLAKQCSSLRDELSQFKERLSNANTYTWKIYDFTTHLAKYPNGSYFTSPVFWLCGHKLHITMYPNGMNEDSAGFLSLFLNVSNEFSTTVSENSRGPFYEWNVSYRLTLIRKDPAKDQSKVTSGELEHLFTGPNNESWGWPKFTKTTKALSTAIISTNDSLTIQCTILLDKPQ